VLEGFQHPDETFDLEYRFLTAVTTLHAAQRAMEQGKTVYARQLLEAQKPERDFPGLERRRLLLLGKLRDSDLSQLCLELDTLDEELYLRARASLEAGECDRGLKLLDAMEQQEPGWYLLRGQILTKMGRYADGAEALKKAESAYPETCIPLLEQCYRELGDFKQAYYYACKQR